MAIDTPILTLEAPTPQNGQTNANNLSAVTDDLFECVWPFWRVGVSRVNAVRELRKHKKDAKRLMCELNVKML